MPFSYCLYIQVFLKLAFVLVFHFQTALPVPCSTVQRPESAPLKLHVQPVGLQHDAEISNSSSLDWALLSKFATEGSGWPHKRGCAVFGHVPACLCPVSYPIHHPSTLLKFPCFRYAMSCFATWQSGGNFSSTFV